MVKEAYDLSNTNNGLIDCGSCGMVFYRGPNGDLRRCNHPHSDHGWCPRGGQAGDCSMVTPELEEDDLVDEVLSNISSSGIDGNHISGYLRVSIESALRTYGEYGWD